MEKKVSNSRINRTEFKEHISEISERIIQELESVGYEKR
jgi:hypothetical protein